MKKLSFLILLTISWTLQAQDCSNVDVAEKNPKLKQFFSTPRDQDSIGWCYAFAAADLLSVRLGFAVSGIHTSLIYNKNLSKTQTKAQKTTQQSKISEINEDGDEELAIKGVSEEWICSEAELPYFTQLTSKLYELISEIEKIRSGLKKNHVQNDCINCIDQSRLRTLQSDFVSLESTELDKIKSLILSKNLNDSLQEFISAKCNNKRKVPSLSVKKIYNYNNSESDKKDFFKKIGGILEKGKPLALAYNDKNIANSSKPGPHESVLMARRWNPSKERCEYKVRNSWGKACLYKKDIECIRDEGSYWISGDLLYESSYYAAYIAN